MAPGSPLLILWRYCLAPILYPILSAPVMLMVIIARPLLIILVLITTGFLYIHWGVGAAFVGIVSLFYAYYHIVRPKDPLQYMRWATQTSAGQPGGAFASIVFTVGSLVAFLISMSLLPAWQPVLRWFAAAGIAYYSSTVAMAYTVILNTPTYDLLE